MLIGPIIIIDDDEDDRQFIVDAIATCGIKNPLIFFYNGKQAFDYLLQTSDQPFIIFCDINMPVMNGLELRRSINSNDFLRNKSIPFIFLSTSDSRSEVIEAYQLTVQGFFKKPNHLDEFSQTIKEILSYWVKCLHPNRE